MANSIKITGDISEFRKSILDLSKALHSGLGKSKIQLFDKDTREFLGKIAAEEAGKIADRMKLLQGFAQKYAREAMNSAKGSERELEAKQKLLFITRKLLDEEKRRQDLGGGEPTFGESFRKGMLGGGMAGKLMRGIGGGPGAMGLLASTAIAGAGAYSMGRVKAGFGRFEEGVDSRIKLMGMGARDVGIAPGMAGRAAGVGMNAEQLRQARMQAMRGFGAAGAGQEQVLGRASFARSFGLDLEQMQGMGAGFRAQVGTSGASRDLFKLQAAAIASGLEDSQIGNYLETTANTLTEIRESGLVDATQLTTAMNAAMRMGVAPERGAQQLLGMQRAVQGSTGEANAFIQTAFGRAGIGGQSIGGVQAAIRSGGIFGINPSDYAGVGGTDRKLLDKIGGGGVQKRGGALLKQLDQLFGGGGGEQARLAEARFAMPILGTKNEADTLQVLNLLKTISEGKDQKKIQEAQEKLKDLTESNEEKSLHNLEAINKSTAGIWKAVTATKEIQEEFTGEGVAPGAILGRRVLNKVDKAIGLTATGLVTNPEQAAAGAAGGIFGMGPGAAEVKEQLTKMVDSLSQMLGLSKEHLEHAKSTSQNTKAAAKPKGQIPANGGKTMGR